MNIMDFTKKYATAKKDMCPSVRENYLRDCFNLYERYGFAKTFQTKAPLRTTDRKYNGKPFKVLERMEEDYDPAWLIQFEDGHRVEAYPEEITNLEKMMSA